MAKRGTRMKMAEVFELELWLADIEPRIMRRFAVLANIKLPKLHGVIQDVMGWTDSHLHAFMTEGKRYTIPFPDLGMDEEALDESKAKLTDLALRPKDRFVYQYDFGDDWNHVVELESIGPPKKGVKYPVCLAGARACPPDDCGGPWGYENFLDAILDPKHQEHEELLEWVGGNFDPERFDMQAVNRLLRANR